MKLTVVVITFTVSVVTFRFDISKLYIGVHRTMPVTGLSVSE